VKRTLQEAILAYLNVCQTLARINNKRKNLSEDKPAPVPGFELRIFRIRSTILTLDL
jgi:hypothetical protein